MWGKGGKGRGDGGGGGGGSKGWRGVAGGEKALSVESESVVGLRRLRCRRSGSFSGALAAARAKASTLSGHLGRKALSKVPPLFLLFAAAAAAEVQKSSESRGRLGFCLLCHRINKKKRQNKVKTSQTSALAGRKRCRCVESLLWMMPPWS